MAVVATHTIKAVEAKKFAWDLFRRDDIEIYDSGGGRLYGYAGEGYSYQFLTDPNSFRNRALLAPHYTLTVMCLTDAAAQEFALSAKKRAAVRMERLKMRRLAEKALKADLLVQADTAAVVAASAA